MLSGIGTIKLEATTTIKNEIELSLERYEVVFQEYSIVNLLLDEHSELSYAHLVQLQLNCFFIGVVVGHSLIPAVSKGQWPVELGFIIGVHSII